MSGFISEWGKNIVAGIMILALTEMLVPRDKFGSIPRMAAGMTVILLIITPAVNIKDINFQEIEAFNSSSQNMEYAALTDDLNKDQWNYAIDVITSDIEDKAAAILDKNEITWKRIKTDIDKTEEGGIEIKGIDVWIERGADILLAKGVIAMGLDIPMSIVRIHKEHS